jgi:hypothetical protein
MRSIRIQWIRRTVRCFGGYCQTKMCCLFLLPNDFLIRITIWSAGKAMGVVEVWEKPGGNVVIDRHDE